MNRSKARTEARGKVRRRIRQVVRGGKERPRLAIFKSARHIYAQIIDDRRGATLVAASSREASGAPEPGKISVSTAVGQRLAERAKEKGISKVAFDRGGYRYHGRVKALADGARAGGLEF